MGGIDDRFRGGIMDWYKFLLEEYSKLLRWCPIEQEYLLPEKTSNIVCRACIDERQKHRRCNPRDNDFFFCKKGFYWNKYAKKYTSYQQFKKDEEGRRWFLAHIEETHGAKALEYIKKTFETESREANG